MKKNKPLRMHARDYEEMERYVASLTPEQALAQLDILCELRKRWDKTMEQAGRSDLKVDNLLSEEQQ